MSDNFDVNGFVADILGSQVSRPLTVSFLIRASGKETDMATPLGREKYGRIDFHWEDGSPLTRKRPNGYKHMPEAQGSLS